MSRTLILTAVLLLLASNAHSDAQSDGQELVLKIFERSCNSCHPAYVGSDDAESITRILSAADTIKDRIASADRPMPPEFASESMQLTSNQKDKVIAALNLLQPEENTSLDDSIVPLSRLRLPVGYKIEILAQVKSARSLHYSDAGVLYVGTGGFSNPDTKVYAIPYRPTDALPINARMLATGLDNPNGVTTIGGDLYVAERTRILRYNQMDRQVLAGGSVPRPQVIYNNFPNERQHSWKYLRTSPEGELVVAQGAPCNICDPDSNPATRGKFNRIFAISPESGAARVLAQGVRNTVGFDFSPANGELWFTDNGRDQMGDDIPADELNRLTQTGQHFGFPFCHGISVADPRFGRGINCRGDERFQKPVTELAAHAAALGMRFYRGSQFAAGADRNSIYIAEHGSWNRSEPTGYRISRVRLDENGNASARYEIFVDGWLNADGSRWGRPVDIENLPDGSLAISDDHAGIVYRLSYEG